MIIKVFIIAVFKSVLSPVLLIIVKRAFLNIMKWAILKRVIIIIKVFIIAVFKCPYH